MTKEEKQLKVALAQKTEVLILEFSERASQALFNLYKV